MKPSDRAHDHAPQAPQAQLESRLRAHFADERGSREAPQPSFEALWREAREAGHSRAQRGPIVSLSIPQLALLALACLGLISAALSAGLSPRSAQRGDSETSSQLTTSSSQGALAVELEQLSLIELDELLGEAIWGEEWLEAEDWSLAAL